MTPGPRTGRRLLWKNMHVNMCSAVICSCSLCCSSIALVVVGVLFVLVVLLLLVVLHHPQQTTPPTTTQAPTPTTNTNTHKHACKHVQGSVLCVAVVVVGVVWLVCCFCWLCCCWWYHTTYNKQHHQQPHQHQHQQPTPTPISIRNNFGAKQAQRLRGSRPSLAVARACCWRCRARSRSSLRCRARSRNQLASYSKSPHARRALLHLGGLAEPKSAPKKLGSPGGGWGVWPRFSLAKKSKNTQSVCVLLYDMYCMFQIYSCIHV